MLLCENTTRTCVCKRPNDFRRNLILRIRTHDAYNDYIVSIKWYCGTFAATSAHRFSGKIGCRPDSRNSPERTLWFHCVRRTNRVGERTTKIRENTRFPSVCSSEILLCVPAGIVWIRDRLKTTSKKRLDRCVPRIKKKKKTCPTYIFGRSRCFPGLVLTISNH